MLVWQCHKLLAKINLSLISRHLHLSINDKGDNKMMQGAVHRSRGICPKAEENPGKPQLGDSLTEVYVTIHRLKWGSLPPNEVGRIA